MSNAVAIVGGGAAGLTAAIFAAQNGREVTVYESGERIGRKILATGNGRCNMTNINADINNYHGNNTKFLLGAINKFWVEETIAFFENLGILTKTEERGKVYPYSDQASAVLDVLRFRLEELNVRIVTGFEVESVKKNGNRFELVSYNGKTSYAEKVIIAAGGRAAPNLGSKGKGYELLKCFGHKITDLKPSLVQLKTDTDVVKIKLNAIVSIGSQSEYGEVLFTDYGLSGPAVFSLTSRMKNDKKLSLDIMYNYTLHQIRDIINARICNNPKMRLENFFVGMLNKKLGQALLKSIGIEPLSRYVVTLNEHEISMLCETLKKWEFNIKGTMSWNNAQVTKGGAVTDEFSPSTMESRLVKGLYAAGEVLDIDGDCGGYNLQWAWSSGYLAGSSV
ncbi:MAG: NAD(P)/FAD-dependent oxidoreductase [Clostridia bacterium]|nr:NAD(P)/FAD-dependent oxidoreductase [Clostridia bacterium]